jgi:CRISPR-associated protein Cas5h
MSTHNITFDKVLIFDLEGPFAHFRKYYTNSSSLTYLFPPRTVIIGLIAGLLGLPSERHTKKINEIYYEQFNKDKCLVAVSLRTRIRRMIQTVNYIRTTSLSEIDGSAGGTQIPLEILVSEKDKDAKEITYRVYFYHMDEGIYTDFKDRLKQQMFVYPPYMGLTEFLASIKYIDEGRVLKKEDNNVKIDTVCKLKEVELDFSNDDLQYITEKMPTGFLNDRKPLPSDEYVLEVKGKSMMVKLNDLSTCYSIIYSDEGLEPENRHFQ